MYNKIYNHKKISYYFSIELSLVRLSLQLKLWFVTNFFFICLGNNANYYKNNHIVLPFEIQNGRSNYTIVQLLISVITVMTITEIYSFIHIHECEMQLTAVEIQSFYSRCGNVIGTVLDLLFPRCFTGEMHNVCCHYPTHAISTCRSRYTQMKFYR